MHVHGGEQGLEHLEYHPEEVCHISCFPLHKFGVSEGIKGFHNTPPVILRGCLANNVGVRYAYVNTHIGRENTCICPEVQTIKHAERLVRTTTNMHAGCEIAWNRTHA